MKTILAISFSMLLLANEGSENTTPEIRFEGLKIWVTDLGEAKKFYQDVLGFKMGEIMDDGAVLNTGAWPIHLAKSTSRNLTDYEKHERTALSIQVSKLLPSIDHLRSKGVELLDEHLQRNGVGISIPFKDPFGNLLSLIEVQIRETPPIDGFRIYNTGITSSAMDKAIDFYEGVLGFQEWSRDYLPQALPLKHGDGSFAFMLHYKPNLVGRSREFAKDSEMNLLFSTSSLQQIVKILKSNKVEIVSLTAVSAAFKDPFGNICEVIEK